MDRARALAAGYSEEEIDAEEARRAGKAAAPPAEPAPSFLRSAANTVAGLAQQPIDLVSGIKRSVGDVGRGAWQAAADVAPGMFDAEAARKAQAAAEAESPTSGAFHAGKFVGDVAPWMAGAGAAPALLSKLPQAAKVAGMLPAWIRGVIGGSAGGAVQGPLSPESEEGRYSLPQKAKEGAMWGAAMGPVGEIAGRLYAPFRNAGSKAAQESAAVLNASGLPKQIPATQTDDKYVQVLSNALEQIPLAGEWLKRARGANARWASGKFTEPTGNAVEELTPEILRKMKSRASASIDDFKTGPDVPTGAIPADLQALAATLIGTPTIASKSNLIRKVGDVEAQLSQSPTRTASEMVELRNEASKMARGEGSYLEKKAASKLQDIVEQAIKDTHGDKGAAFDIALKRYGATKDTLKAAGELGENLSEGGLPVSRMVEGSKAAPGMFPDRDKIVAALAGNTPTPPSGWNRALYTSLLLGAPLAAGGVSKIAGGDASWGTVPTTGLAAALIAGLSRKAPTKAEIDAIRRLTMGAGVGADPFN